MSCHDGEFVGEDMIGAEDLKFWGYIDVRCLINEVMDDVKPDTLVLWITLVVHMRVCSAI